MAFSIYAKLNGRSCTIIHIFAPDNDASTYAIAIQDGKFVEALLSDFTDVGVPHGVEDIHVR